ncbi:MAG: carboxymuconolactone decarboxylase family protein [Anaerolineales bacterium]|jgi:AhpD family alkylhydroperoxidase
MNKNYPEKHQHIMDEMKKLGSEIPKTMGSFSQLHKAAAGNGALSTLTKELIALSIAVVVRCDGCIAFHVHDALEAGATREEITEAIGVAILMGGGPAVMYGVEALEALDQFEEVSAPVPA